MSKPVAVITGVGAGLGASLARKFAAEGCAVAMLARSQGFINDLARTIASDGGKAIGVPADVTSQEAVSAAFECIRKELGPTDILINHAGNATWSAFSELTPYGFERSWRICAMGAFLACKESVKDMEPRGSGSILFTGATSSIRGRAGGIAFTSAKFASRGLADSLAREVWPKGIHVAHVIIDGVLDTAAFRAENPDIPEDEPLIDTDEAAEQYWMLTRQKPSAWSFEITLRPKNEAFFT